VQRVMPVQQEQPPVQHAHSPVSRPMPGMLIGASPGVFLVRTPNLQVDFSSLSSEPLASGTVPGANKGFVAQQHPEGRITFIDLNEGAQREITGFELSSKVVNE